MNYNTPLFSEEKKIGTLYKKQKGVILYAFPMN